MRDKGKELNRDKGDKRDKEIKKEIINRDLRGDKRDKNRKFNHEIFEINEQEQRENEQG